MNDYSSLPPSYPRFPPLPQGALLLWCIDAYNCQCYDGQHSQSNLPGIHVTLLKLVLWRILHLLFLENVWRGKSSYDDPLINSSTGLPVFVVRSLLKGAYALVAEP